MERKCKTMSSRVFQFSFTPRTQVIETYEDFDINYAITVSKGTYPTSFKWEIVQQVRSIEG